MSASLRHMKEHWAGSVTAGQHSQLARESQLPDFQIIDEFLVSNLISRCLCLKKKSVVMFF